MSVPIHDFPHIETAGRVVRNAHGITLFWTGSSVDFRVSGSELSVDIEVPETSLCPWVCIYLNDHLLQRCLLRRGMQTLTVYSHLNYRDPKDIRIIKESPALLQNADYAGETLFTVTGITADGSFSELPKKKLKIELIGDSITSGEGLYGYPGLITEDLWFFTAQQELHYGMRIARERNADLRIVTQAGWGVYIGYTNMTSYNIPSVYDRVCGVQTSPFAQALGSQEPYDFLSWQPDLIIVNLGTNDAAAFSNPGYTDPETGLYTKMRKNADGSLCAEDRNTIRQAAISFLSTLRMRNPGAHILWAYGMMGHELCETLQDAVHAFSDPHAAFLTLPDTLPGEFGSVDHPGAPSHKKTADTILSAIRDLMIPQS